MSKWKQALDAAVSGQTLPHLMPPHIKFLSLPAISSWQDNQITINWTATEAIYQGGGMVFGGYLSALADYAAGTAMLTAIEDDDIFATHKLTIEYKKPVRAGSVTLIAEVVKVNAKHYDVCVTFTDANKAICAVANVHQTIF